MRSLLPICVWSCVCEDYAEGLLCDEHVEEQH